MKEMMYCMAIAEAMKEEMERDESIVAYGLDQSQIGGMFMQSMGLYQQFGPERVMDAPISESGYTGVAVGMALGGLRTVVEVQFGDFMAYAFDAVANQAAKMRYLTGGQCHVPLVIRTAQGNGMYFGAQYSQCVEAWFQNVPGLKIVAPATSCDAKGLLKAAIRDDDPVLFLESKSCMFRPGELPEEDYLIPLGKAKVEREGTDVTVIAVQSMLFPCLDAAEELEKEGIHVEVINPRSIIPLDTELLCASARKTGRVMVVHEAPVRGGVGAEIAAVITQHCFHDLKAPVSRVGALNLPIPFDPAEEYVIPGVDEILTAVRQLMKQ